MSMAAVLLAFIGMLLIAVMLEPLAQRLRLPSSLLLAAAGFAGASLIVAAGIDTGLRWQYFHDLAFYVVLPLLIFESALRIDARRLLRELPALLILAIPLLLLTLFLSAALVYAGIDHPRGFPWTTALVCGALLATTEPFTLTGLARRLRVPQRLLVLMEGESLLSDTTGIVLFTLLVAIAGGALPQADAAVLGSRFLGLFAGGILTGLAAGTAAAWLLRNGQRPAVVTLLAAWGAYLLAEIWLQVSGVMAVLAVGLLCGTSLRRLAPAQAGLLEWWWEQLGWISASTLFLLAGATFTLAMFEQRWLAMLIGIAAVLLARVAGIALFSLLPGRLPGIAPLPAGYATLMAWGGQRGAVTLALALSLPTSLEAWWTVQSIAYGVVLFSLLVQAPTLGPLLAWLRGQGRGYM